MRTLTGGWFSPSLVSAGFIAVLVGYTSSAAIVFQAANAAGATPAEMASWMCVLGIGMGLTCIGLSLWSRTPVLTAWSTPGAALLATGLSGLSMNQAIGVFLFNSLLLTIVGFSGWFDRIMRHVPGTLAAAMLGGVLLRFGLDVFVVLPTQGVLVGSMLACYFVSRRFIARYAVVLTLLLGLIVASASGLVQTSSMRLEVASPVWMTPDVTLASLIGVGLPLFVVTMASQNLPGLAVLRANGYQTPASPLIGWTGLTGIVFGAFGGFSYNLAAITAAICMSRDADPDPARRYRAAVWAGIFYLLTGIFGATVVGLFVALPRALVVTIAGLALLGTIASGLAGALAHEKERDAALVTFLVTASGLTIAGIGSAFWGLVLGLAVHWLNRRP